MSKARVVIIGAGISGLTLARSLKYRGLPAIIYERDTAQRFASRHDYGITLWAYQPLVEILGHGNTYELRTRIAVDGENGGTGHVGSRNDGGGIPPFRVNRQKLERLLYDGLDIRWGHKLQDIKTSASSPRIQLQFENDHQADVDVVIGTDGVHSKVRNAISPSTKFNILPYAVYNGKRKIPRAEFDEKYAPYLRESTTSEQNIGDVHLTLSIDNYKGDQVHVSYSYSRPAKEDDQLFRPDRPMSGAKEIPSALFDEISGLRGLNKPLGAVFNADSVRNDRLLHWLMRSVSTADTDLRRGAKEGIVLLADAAHAGPILGGDGANVAIEDAVELAELLSGAQQVDLEGFYRSRSERWKICINDSEARLAKVHGQPAAHL